MVPIGKLELERYEFESRSSIINFMQKSGTFSAEEIEKVISGNKNHLRVMIK